MARTSGIAKVIFIRVVALLATLCSVVFGQQTASQPSPEKATGDNAPSAQQRAVNPPFRTLRADEDYGYLSDEDQPKDLLDRLKYIRLRKGMKDWYLSLGGEIRPTYEYYANTNFGRGPQDDNGYFYQRYMFHADLRLGQNVRVFAQLKSGLVNDKSSPLIPPDLNKADVNALFVDLNFGVKRAEKDKPNYGQRNHFGYLPPRLTLRIGRQELNFGSGRMVSVRNGPNVRQTHDGISLIWREGQWKIDALATKPVSDSRGYFDDRPRRDQTFWGIHGTRPFFGLSKNGKIDVYYFGLDRKAARFDQGISRDIRHTFGARFWNGGREFDYDLEVTGQLGEFGSSSIRAWAISPSVGYTFVNTRFRPRIGFDAGIVSGDTDPTDRVLNTFSPPFPRGQYFGLSAANGPYNVQGFRPSLRLTFPRAVVVGIGNYFFWRQSRNDGLYNVAGALIRTGTESRALCLGQSFETEFAWQINRNSGIQAGTSVFYAGKFLNETPPAQTIKVFLLRYTYVF